jgi:cellulose synthase/poly-beta-1,6-N-acetylglucosamine synthase-like glycosyltransferase
MAVVLTLLKLYFIFTIGVMVVYAIRHLLFSYSRLFGRQKISYRDVYDSELPTVSILIPMHNEELVAADILDDLLKCDYDKDKLQIIPINDCSTDKTGEIIDGYHARSPFIQPLHREKKGQRGKPASLNDALPFAQGDIVIIFDADYRPTQNLIKKLVSGFSDPQVGAVMGRVIPINTNSSLLTNLLNLERTGGYQVDQQARYNMNLIPQYGGTVGGFRRHLILETNGFDERILAEDTELTYRLYLRGWRIIYDNSAECYEQSPETWKSRGRQVRRWSRGHNAVLAHYLLPTITTDKLRFWAKADAVLLLFVYTAPLILALAFLDCIALFFLGEMNILGGWWVLLFVGIYNTGGNFSPFYQVAAGALLDGMRREITLLPLLCFSYYFYMVNISAGFFEAQFDLITRRKVMWAKTERTEWQNG